MHTAVELVELKILVKERLWYNYFYKYLFNDLFPPFP